MVEFLAVAVLFVLFAGFLTNWVIFDIDRTLFTSGVGDATSGFLWLLYANDGTSLWNGSTNLINYPYGEVFWSPVYITWLFVLGPLWLLSLVLSPIAALNVMMIVGFVTAGLAVYYLVKRIAGSRILGFIAGYTVTFAPYHILKAPDHLTNIFIWPLVGTTAFLVAFWRKQTWPRALGLAASVAAAVYTDGYFIFIVGILLVTLTIALVATDVVYRVSLKAVMRKVGRLAHVALLAVVLLLPVAIVQLSAGSDVGADLANSRGDIKNEVRWYSSKPIDFLLPPKGNITVGDTDWYRNLAAQKDNRSNIGESTTYVGYTVLLLFVTGLYFVIKSAWIARKSRDHKLSLSDQMLTICMIAAPLVLVWMLPPVIHILGVPIRTPIDFLTDYLALWRVPARLFLILHMFIVVAAMLVLSMLTARLHKHWRNVIFFVVLALISLETYSNIKRPSFGLGDMPSTYSWLKTQDNIKAVAELPLLDWPVEVSGYYVFGQLIHGKPLVNTALARNESGLFNSLADQTNPETIDFLRLRGVDAILIHARSCQIYEWGKIIHQEKLIYSPEYIDKSAKMLCTYSLNKAGKTDRIFAFLGEGFAKKNYLDERGGYWNAMDKSKVQLKLTDNAGMPVGDVTARLHFDIGVIGGYQPKTYQWSIEQGGKMILSGDTSDSSQVDVVIDGRKSIVFKVYAKGGHEISPGEVGLNRIQVTDLADIR